MRAAAAAAAAAASSAGADGASAAAGDPPEVVPAAYSPAAAAAAVPSDVAGRASSSRDPSDSGDPAKVSMGRALSISRRSTTDSEGSKCAQIPVGFDVSITK